MARRLFIQDHQIQAGTTSISITLDDNIHSHRFYTSGAVTLTGALTVSASGTAQKGDLIEIEYDANLDFDGNTVSILGTIIPEKLESVVGLIRCYYDGSSWQVKFIPKIDESSFIDAAQIVDDAVTNAKIANLAVDTDQLAADAVESAKIADGAVTAAKMDSSAQSEVISMNLSFETGEQGEYRIVMPYACTVDQIDYIVTKAIAGTDDATIDVTANGSPTTPGTITITASTVVGTAAKTSITGSNTIAAAQNLSFTTAKTTAGGKVTISIKITRT